MMEQGHFTAIAKMASGKTTGYAVSHSVQTTLGCKAVAGIREEIQDDVYGFSSRTNSSKWQ